MILALDPSSTRVGYALMRGHVDLIEAGALRPADAAMEANERLVSMNADLVKLIRESKPERIIIEDTGAHMHAGRGGAGAGLMVYGKAVGFFLNTCITEVGANRITAVEAQVWSRGVKKEKRQAWVAAQFRQYDKRRDKGMDISDAISLGQWWFAQSIKPTECLRQSA